MNLRKRKLIQNCLATVANALVTEVTEAIDEEVNRQRSEWVREWLKRRNTHGASALLLRELAFEDVLEYKMCLRMTPVKFEELLNMVNDKIERQDMLMRDAIKPRVKLDVTLNFLATGSSYRSLSHFFRVSRPAISKFIPEVCDAISEVLRESIKVPSGEEWNTVAEGFKERWNFPNCCGAIDGKHILIKEPPNSGSEYFNYKGHYSVVLMAVVDHKYCFSYINVGFKGSNSDGGVFQNCAIYEALENNLLPDGLFLVGDDAFPLKMYLMKPYSGYRRRLTINEQVFNYRLSRARRISENAFGLLVSRFRVFEKPLAVQLTTVNKVVSAACSLHNWLTETSPDSYFVSGCVDKEIDDSGAVIPGQWRNEISELRNLEPYGGSQSTAMAKKMRNRLRNYFNNDGAVPWQYKNVF